MEPAATRRPPLLARALGAPGAWLLALLAYVPALSAAPGRMPTDTKLYLYLDPGRLVRDAPVSWDGRQFAGWVPHQTIAYLWPSGPWFWVLDRLSVPDWVAHRLWIGTILVLGGLGVRFAARQLGLRGAGPLVAAVVYQLSPYVLPYVSRTSVMLLPWAGVGWLVGLTVRAARRPGWRDPALFALVVLTVGAVNATATALIAPAPVLWLVHAAWRGTIGPRRALALAAKLGGLSLLVSLWWIAMLVVQGRHGADVLAFSETLDAVSLTSVSTEVLRGFGYWLFYVRDPYAFTTTAVADYLGSGRLLLTGFLLVALGCAGLALSRWGQRGYAALLVATGVVLGVGVHPIDDPSPLMSPLEGSSLGLALRSSTRAIPVANLGLALGAGALAVVVGGRVRRPVVAGRVRAEHLVGAVVVVLAVGNLPALFDGGFVDPALERDEDVPAAWREAARALDASSLEHRVLQLPGSEFGAFRWGYTVDPPLPGLTDKPLVTRDLLPLGSPGVMDLLYALDDRLQAGTVEPGAIAPVARLLAADTIWVANDLAFDRFRTPRPEVVSDLLAGGEVPGLGPAAPHGAPVPNVPVVPVLDERDLSDPRLGTPLAPVELVPVEGAPSIVRASGRVVVLAGSGDGVVDAAAAGLIRGDEAIVYAADVDEVERRATGGIADPALVVVTDSNRDRASHWRSSQDVRGMTEVGGPAPDVTRDNPADQRLEVFPDADEASQTVARLEHVDGTPLVVRASAYGEPAAYRPEQRPAMAVDGDPRTAWVVADRADPTGESIELSDSGPSGRLVVLQSQRPGDTRAVTRIRIEQPGEAAREVELTPASRVAPGEPVEVLPGSPVRITILAVTAVDGTDTGPSAVGFAELGPVATEVVRPPVDASPLIDADVPVAVVLTRERVRATDRWRSDPEPVLVRDVELPVGRTADVAVTLRLDARAADDVLDRLLGTGGRALADRRLTGVVAARGASAVDGDPGTAWTMPFGRSSGATLRVRLDPSRPVSEVALVQRDDELHSRISRVRLTVTGPSGTVAHELDIPAGGGAMAVPAASGTEAILEVLAVEPRTTLDRRYAETTELPAAVVELTLTGPGGDAVAAPTSAPPGAGAGCRTDLLALDGEPFGLALDPPTLARLVAGEAVEVSTCDARAVSLAAGTHRWRGANGLDTGIDVDRVVLRSGVAAAVTAPAAPQVDVRRTRTERVAQVAACPDGCWLILGEGYNPAWTARVEGPGGDLGAPVQIAGGFNGWWLEPSDATRTVAMRWTPQRGLDLALALAGVGVLACVLLAAAPAPLRTAARRVLRARRADRTPTGPDGTPPAELDGPVLAGPSPVGRTHATASAAALVVLAGLVVAPAWALWALAPAAVVVVTRRPRLLALASVALTLVLGAVVVVRVVRERYFANAGWTAHFEDLHRAGVFVVVLLVVGCVTAAVPRRPPEPEAAAADAGQGSAGGVTPVSPG